MKLQSRSPAGLGIKRLLVSGLGMGYMPVASGTWASLAACALSLAVWGALRAAGADLRLLDLCWVLLMLLASAGCVYWAPWAIEYYGPRCRKPGDPSMAVLDEFAGQWVALLALPMPTLPRALLVLGVQFVLFRIFDITKPPPARQAERLPLGWGILTDDLVAGMYANLVGQLIFRYFVP